MALWSSSGVLYLTTVLFMNTMLDISIGSANVEIQTLVWRVRSMNTTSMPCCSPPLLYNRNMIGISLSFLVYFILV